jgi:hypothetical protein
MWASNRWAGLSATRAIILCAAIFVIAGQVLCQSPSDVPNRTVEDEESESRSPEEQRRESGEDLENQGLQDGGRRDDIEQVVDLRLTRFANEKVTPLSSEFTAAKWVLTLGVAVVALLFGAAGYSLNSQFKKVDERLAEFDEQSKRALAVIDEKWKVNAGRRDKRTDLAIRGIRYAVEKTRSEYATNDEVRNTLAEVYYGLELFTSQIRDVRMAVKALRAGLKSDACSEWLLEARILWEQQLDSADDETRCQDIRQLLREIDTALKSILHRTDETL